MCQKNLLETSVVGDQNVTELIPYHKSIFNTDENAKE